MWCHLTIMIGGLILGPGSGDPGPSQGPQEFESWFRQGVDETLEISRPVERRAQGFRYVFVGGFRNEQMPGYFAQNMAELRALGVPQERIEVIHPDSRQDSESNLGEVKARFLQIAEKGSEKLVVIAHSRGACDALAFAIGDARFVERKVEALFLIQGPFGGSGVAEFLVGDGPEMDRRMPFRYRVVGSLLARLARQKIKKSGSEAVEGMTRQASREFWSTLIENHPEALPVVGPKTFYIRAATDPGRLRPGRRAIAWYLQIYHGRGDGVVSLADQSLAGVGSIVGTLEAGHADLTQKGFATRAPRSYRKGLARAIFKAVGHSPGDPMAIPLSRSTSAAADRRFDLGENAIPESQAGFEGLDRGDSGLSPSQRVVAADR